MDGGESVTCSNRLLLGPPPDTEETAFYLERASSDDRPVPSVIVSTRHSAIAILESYREYIGGDLPEIDVIVVDESSHVPAAHSREDDARQLVSVGTHDLPGLGIAISESLARQEGNGPIHIWFDSLTPLIRTLGLESQF